MLKKLRDVFMDDLIEVREEPMAEAQRFLHGAAADAVEVERLQRLMQEIMARCADLLDEDQFNELDAIARATDSASGGDK